MANDVDKHLFITRENLNIPSFLLTSFYPKTWNHKLKLKLYFIFLSFYLFIYVYMFLFMFRWVDRIFWLLLFIKQIFYLFFYIDTCLCTDRIIFENEQMKSYTIQSMNSIWSTNSTRDTYIHWYWRVEGKWREESEI